MPFSSVDPARLTEAPDLSPPNVITQASPDTVVVLPRSEGVLSVSLFLKPRAGIEYGTDAEGAVQDRLNLVPDHLFIHDAEALAAGALSRILMVPGEDWTDPAMAGVWTARFNAAADAAFARPIKGQHRARARTRAQWL